MNNFFGGSIFPDELPDEAPGKAPSLPASPGQRERYTDNENREVVDEAATVVAPLANDSFEEFCNFFFAAPISPGTPGRDFPRELPDETPCETPSLTASPGSRERYTNDENREVVDEAATAVAPFANDSLNQCSPEELHCNFFFAVSNSLSIPGRDFPRELLDEEPWEAPSFTASERDYTPSALDEYTELCFASLEPSPDG